MIIAAVFLALLLWSTQAMGAAAVVQSRTASSSGGNTVTTSSMATTPGNLIVCDAAYYLAGASLVGITDSKGNTYTASIAELASPYDTETRAIQVYKENAAGGVSHNFTITWSSGAYGTITCKEISGVLTSGALDKTSSTIDQIGTTGLSSGATATTAQNDEILLGGGAVSQPTSGVTAFTPQSGFSANSNISHDNSTPVYGLLSASKVVSVTGAYEFTFDADQIISALVWVSTWKATITGAPTVAKRRIISGD